MQLGLTVKGRQWQEEAFSLKKVTNPISTDDYLSE